LLGDGSLRRSAPNHNARLIFVQSIINFEYFWHVFTTPKGSHFCSSLPYLDKTTLKDGKTHFIMRIFTRTYPCISILFDMWIVNGVKVVPLAIFDLLTPVAFAHWIMCDGYSHSGGGMYLCTDNFTIPDVVRLMNVLLVKYEIPSRIHYINGLPRIYIRRADINRVRAIVTLSLFRVCFIN